MRSMTGYGNSRGAADGVQWSVEVQSVNRKQSELVVNLPRELGSLEPRVREAVNARALRGRLVVNVSVQARPSANGADAPAPALDTTLARTYYRAMLALQKELGAGGEIGIETVLRAPGVLRLTAEESAPLAPESVWPHVEGALGLALAELLAMRAREGAHLAADLRARLDVIAAQMAVVRERQPLLTQHYRRALLERLERAQLAAPIDEERLAREVVLFAERSDIAEELTRLDSHLEQFRSLLDKDDAVGRPMDFLSQEIARELNTLGAKANDLPINQATLACKAELDKIREQVQNIE